MGLGGCGRCGGPARCETMKRDEIPMTINGFHLPALNPEIESTRYESPGGESFELRSARLNPDGIGRQVNALLDARDRWLADRPVSSIIQVIDRVARRFLDERDSLRSRALEGISVVSEYSRPMARLVLDRMASDWRTGALQPLVVEEFGDPPAIDGFVGRSGHARKVRAIGPKLTVHFFSGNVPGVAVTSLIRALLVKSASLGKTARGEPLLAPLFAQALAEEDHGLGEAIAVAYWEGGDESLETVALDRAEAVIVYGGQGAVESIRRRVPPAVRFLGYGHRLSFGVIAREALADECEARKIAADAALAVATFDQHGCVSPHLFYIEDDGAVTPDLWASYLGDALAALSTDLPRGQVTAAESTAIRAARTEAEFARLAGSGHQLHTSPTDTSWTVIFDPDQAFVPSCLNRLARVKPVSSIDEVPRLVATVGSVLQTIGVAGARDRVQRLAEHLAELGASRITSLAKMPWPPQTWHHDGRPPLSDLVRWSDLD